MSTWRKITHKDLRGRFDDTAKDVILFAMRHGAVGRQSSNGHLIIRSPNGRTMSVTRDSFKSSKVVRQNLRRLFPGAN